MAFLKKMRGNPKDDSEKAAAGAKQMKMLRRIPQMLRFIPGTAQDLRAYFLTLQYWRGGSQENIQGMVHYLADRYAGASNAKSKAKVLPPVEYPEVGIYHPRMKSRLSDQMAELPTVVSPDKARGRVGLILLRSYLIAGNAQHYDAVIAAMEVQGLNVVPIFASGLDSTGSKPRSEPPHWSRVWNSTGWAAM